MIQQIMSAFLRADIVRINKMSLSRL